MELKEKEIICIVIKLNPNPHVNLKTSQSDFLLNQDLKLTHMEVHST